MLLLHVCITKPRQNVKRTCSLTECPGTVRAGLTTCIRQSKPLYMTFHRTVSSVRGIPLRSCRNKHWDSSNAIVYPVADVAITSSNDVSHFSSATWSRRSRRRIFPDADLGMTSVKTTPPSRRLNGATRSLTHALMFSAVAEAPALSTT